MDREIDRCRGEIAAIEAALLASNPDIEGLLLALSDWSAELRILQNEQRRRIETRRRERVEMAGAQPLTE